MADIRSRMSEEKERLRARAALRRPWSAHAYGWHEAFLDSIARGATISAAAATAGVSRNAVYWARQNAPGFEHALRLMWAARGSTMKRNRLTQNRANVASVSSTGTVQNAPTDAALENRATETRNLFPLPEESAIFRGIPNARKEACRP